MDLTYNAVSNSGERVLAGDPPELLRMHEERYQFALDLVEPGQKLIDCACGSGYGSALLATRAGQVLGVDISSVAVAYAEEMHSSENLTFKEASALEIPVADTWADLYVSFETIEHIKDPLCLVEEAYRVLKPGGVFIVSTPNRVWSGLAFGEQPKNPFHLVEWSLLEFDGIVRHSFEHMNYYGQRIRSHNKFHPKYVRSKFRRACRSLDILQLSGDRAALEALQDPANLQPENFLAICRKRG